MKQKLLNIQFLIYAVVLVVVASLLRNYLEGRNSNIRQNNSIDIARFEKVLHQKEHAADSAMSIVQNCFQTGDGLVKNGSIYIINKDLPFDSESGIFVLVFENDTLCYWTDNAPTTEKTYSQANLFNRVCVLNSAFYDVQWRKSGSFTYVGLVFLKNHYTDGTNKYLVDDFHPDFNLESDVRLALSTITYGINIVDIYGAYIFSLVLTGNSESSDGDFTLVGIMFIASLVLLLIFFYNIIKKLSATHGNRNRILLVIFGVILLRAILFVTKIPPSLYSLDFFDPVYFGGSLLFPTLGDVIENIIFILGLVVYLFQLFDYINVKDKLNNSNNVGALAIAIVDGLLFVGLFAELFCLCRSMVASQQVSLNLTDIASLNVFSFGELFVFLVVFGIVIYSIAKATSYITIDNEKQFKRCLIIDTIATVVFFVFVWLKYDIHAALGVLYLGVAVAICLHMHYTHTESSLYRYVLLIFISALFSTDIVVVGNNKKIDALYKESVVYPSNNHDVVAELLLENMSEKFQADQMVADYVAMKDRVDGKERLQFYLQNQYFSGYWSKYNFSLKLIDAHQGELFEYIDDDFVKQMNKTEESVGLTGFFFLENPDGTISYIHKRDVFVGQKTVYVCITLTMKPTPTELGYPELLMSSDFTPSPISTMNYAKYHAGHRVAQNGRITFSLSDAEYIKMFDSQGDSIQNIVSGDYVNTIYRSGNNTVVLCRPNGTFADLLINFAYIFVLYILALLIVSALKMVVEHNLDFRYQLKTRLIFSVTLILIVSFVFICVASAYTSINRFKKQNRDNIDEKMKSISMELEKHYGDSAYFSQVWTPDRFNETDNFVGSLSNIFFIDLNIYNPNGELVACSRPEVFIRGLQGRRINSTALKELAVNQRPNYIQEEQIGKLSFTSAYIPFYNSKEQLTGYINMPFFSNPEKMKTEIYNLIVSVVNLYVVLMMISIVLAVFISERIVQPLRMIQHKLESIELGKKHEKIEYSRKDELGQLVGEYNKMAEKLEESAALLAKSERESAWREMARQIAHEIKNPLTPMKLSIQFLMRSKQNNAPNFDGILEKVSNTLIQQIDTLSTIATEFSNFAKMPKPNAAPFNVVEVLENVIQLFKNEENIDLTSDLGGNSNLVIVADKEQISRVFINLIKNATQAIPDGIRGKIHVTLVKGENVEIRVKDNGSGIPEDIKGKLFTPNFTTKSSGSGLGLAMCRNIVTLANGTITFESEEGVGTTFIVTLPLGN